MLYPEKEVIKWSEDRNQLQTITIEKMVFKFLEELGEFSRHCIRRNKPAVEDALGDMYVILVQIAYLCGFSFNECAWKAYEEIKDRKGVLINDMFVKEEDLKNDKI